MQISEIIFEFLAQNGLNEVVLLGIPIKKLECESSFFRLFSSSIVGYSIILIV